MSIFFILALFIIIILISRIKFALEVKHNKNIVINLFIFEVIKIKIIDKNKKRAGKKAFIKESIPPKLIIKILKEAFFSIDYFLSKSSIKLKFDMIYGFSTPDKTAFFYGLLNSFIYSIDSVLKYKTKKYDASYNITPNLNEAIIDINMNFSISIRVFNSLRFIIKLIKILIKHKLKSGIKGGVIYGTSN